MFSMAAVFVVFVAFVVSVVAVVIVVVCVHRVHVSFAGSSGKKGRLFDNGFLAVVLSLGTNIHEFSFLVIFLVSICNYYAAAGFLGIVARHPLRLFLKLSSTKYDVSTLTVKPTPKNVQIRDRIPLGTSIRANDTALPPSQPRGTRYHCGHGNDFEKSHRTISRND